MKRQFASTSSVDEPQRNVRSCNHFTPSMPGQRAVSLEQPHVNFPSGVQSMAPNLHADHQSTTSVSGESISSSSDTQQGLQALAGSTSPRVCVQCGGLVSALDERSNSLSSEVPPPASDPLIPSTSPNLRSNIPASEERSTVSLTSTSPVDEPQRHVRSRNPFARSTARHFRIAASHLSEQPQNRTSQGQTSNHSQYQNPQIIPAVQHRNMRMDINSMRYEELLALEERIGTVNTGVKTSELSKFVKKVICCGEQDEAERCVICLEQYADTDAKGQLKCGHEYHFSCIGKWMEEKAACPICRQRAAHFEQ